MSYRFPSIPSDLAKAVLGSEFTVSVMVVSKHGFDDADSSGATLVLDLKLVLEPH